MTTWLEENRAYEAVPYEKTLDAEIKTDKKVYKAGEIMNITIVMKDLDGDSIRHGNFN